jgi:hypothetical protein
MRACLIAAAVVGVVSAGAIVGFSQSKPSAAQSIEGAWKITSHVTTGANAFTNTSWQPSIYIYTKKHYSHFFQTQAAPRPPVAAPKDANKLTDAEKLMRYEAWLPVTAQSGTYEIKGTTLIQHTLASKAPAPATGYADNIRELKFEGVNTMVQIAKSADGKSETRRTFTRLE